MDTIGVNIPIEDAIGNITRIAKLEDLCRDMFHVIWGEDTSTRTYEMFKQRMEQLGLLEGEQ